MRTRPRYNRRRGLLRAAAAAVALIVLVLLALIVTSVLTPSAANAPAIPPTPITEVTPIPLGTPPKTVVKGKTPAPTNKATPIKTKGKSQSFRLNPVLRRSRTYEADRSPGSLFSRASALAAQTRLAIRAPDGQSLAWWTFTGDVTGSNYLHIQHRGVSRTFGIGDPLIRPVWSPDSRFLVYARVRQTSSFPGARWTLLKLDTVTGRIIMMTSRASLGIAPLGESHGQFLYMVANSTDTSLYSWEGGATHLVSVLMPQVITSASLSPDGKFIAFNAPTNCYDCTLDIYNLQSESVAIGPTGVPDERDLAWTSDSQHVVILRNGALDAVTPDGKISHAAPFTSGLPLRWVHVMRAAVSASAIRVTDTVTRISYTSRL